MHLHIIGICGTFMGSLALLARELGHQVRGCDANTYPPMSTQLEECGIDVLDGYRGEHLDARPDLVLVGNTISRGNPVLERALAEGLPYLSGPQWLAQYVLRGRWVLGVAGTHGKTSTSAMLAWILEYAGLHPGFLIGGVTNNFPVSARLGQEPFFVIEADEYDSAFCDKRSKFLHYAPRTTILNNLEFDHADIFEDLAAIQRQFHHLLRVLPGNGRIVMPADEAALDAVLAQGCWTPAQRIGFDLSAEQCAGFASAAESDSPAGGHGANGGSDAHPAKPLSNVNLSGTDVEPVPASAFWNIRPLSASGEEFELQKYQAGKGEPASVTVRWNQTGMHNLRNAAAAMVAAEHAGVPMRTSAQALGQFLGVKRRLELRGEVDGVAVYDDFAHHPTAIETTLGGLAAKLGGDGRIIAVIEPRSNTMKAGVHQHTLAASVARADLVVWFQPESCGLDCAGLAAATEPPSHVFEEVEDINAFLVDSATPGDHIVIMSNGGFGGIHEKLLRRLRQVSGP